MSSTIETESPPWLVTTAKPPAEATSGTEVKATASSSSRAASSVGHNLLAIPPHNADRST
jgi:type II secretory pathway component HofQ